MSTVNIVHLLILCILLLYSWFPVKTKYLSVLQYYVICIDVFYTNSGDDKISNLYFIFYFVLIMMRWLLIGYHKF